MVRTGELRLHRTFDAPRSVVFDALTQPSLLAGWFGLPGCTTQREAVRLEVRVGGRWSVTMVRDSDGRRLRTGGTYREVKPPAGVVFTCVNPVSPPGRPWTSLVTMELIDGTSCTEMTLYQTGLRTNGELDGARSQWTHNLDALADRLRDRGACAS